VCDRVAVMYAGQVVEQGTVDQVFYTPTHPYTQGLLDSVPTTDLADGAIEGIPGSVPPPDSGLVGCWFAPRCPHSTVECRDGDPPLVESGPGQWSRCIRWDSVSLPGVRR